MLNVPEEIKNLFDTDSVKKEIIVSFPNGELPDILCDQIVEGSFSFQESLCSQSHLELGLCEASYVQFETVGTGNIKGFKIKVDCIIDCSLLGEEWCELNATTRPDVSFPFYTIPYGIFYVDTCAKKSGATKNRRTIKAYTREAYNDWEVDTSIQRVLSSGWYKNDPIILPVDVIKKLSFPYMCQGSWITAGTEMSSTVSQPYYYDANDRRYNMVLRTIYRKVTITVFDFKSDLSDYNGVHSKLVRYSMAYSKACDEFRGRVREAIIEKLHANGYHMKNYDFLTSDSERYAHMEVKGYVYDKSYFGLNNGSQIVYPSESIYPDVIARQINKYGEVFDGATFLYTNNDSAGNTQAYYGYRTGGYTEITLTVPIGLRVGVGAVYTPDFITQNDTTFDDATLKYFIDSNYGQYSISVERKVNGTVKALRSRNDSYDIVDKTTYYSESTNISIRDILEAEAELQGLLGKFNRYGGFEYISLNSGIGLYPREDLYPSENLYPQEPNLVLPSTIYSSAEWEDQYNKPFDRVSVEYTDIDGNTVYTYIPLVDMTSEYYDPNGYQEYILSNNWFIKNQRFTAAEIQAILETVASNISGIKYMPSEVELRGLPYLEAGDYVEFLTEDSGFQTIILQNTIQGEMYLTQNISSN